MKQHPVPSYYKINRADTGLLRNVAPKQASHYLSPCNLDSVPVSSSADLVVCCCALPKGSSCLSIPVRVISAFSPLSFPSHNSELLSLNVPQ